MRGVPEGLVGEVYIGGEEQVLWRGDGEETAGSWGRDQWSERVGAGLYGRGTWCGGRKGWRAGACGEVRPSGHGGRSAVHEEEIEAVLRKTSGVAEAAVAI